MEFSLNKSLEIIENFPNVLSALLLPLSEEWITHNEGENTWSAKEIVAHLIVCEETNWLPRIRIILSDHANKIIEPMDMLAHLELAQKLSMHDLLISYASL